MASIPPGEVTAVLTAAKRSRHYTALALIAATGLRRGEALALSWDHVDLDAATIKVTATISRINNRLVISEPKSDSSRRTVPLADEVVAMLRRHRTRQLAEKLRAGDRWTNSGLVSTTKLASPGMCTGTPASTPPAPQSTAWTGGWAVKGGWGMRWGIYPAGYRPQGRLHDSEQRIWLSGWTSGTYPDDRLCSRRAHGAWLSRRLSVTELQHHCNERHYSEGEREDCESRIQRRAPAAVPCAARRR